MTSKNPDLKIGGFYRGLARGPHCEPCPDQCYKIIRIATEEEYIECLESFGKERAWIEMSCAVDGPWFYYEIQTD